MFAFLALIVSVVLGVWAAFNLRSGGGTFLLLAYGAGVVTYVAHLVTRPPERAEFSAEQNYLWRRHFVTLVLPVAGREISGALNMLRMLGFPWALWFAWRGLWVHAGLAAFLFWLMGPLCVWFAPYVYYADPATRGPSSYSPSLSPYGRGSKQNVRGPTGPTRGARADRRPASSRIALVNAPVACAAAPRAFAAMRLLDGVPASPSPAGAGRRGGRPHGERAVGRRAVVSTRTAATTLGRPSRHSIASAVVLDERGGGA